MGNIKISKCVNGDVKYIHTKNVIDEVAWDKTPTSERMFVRDTWILRKNPEEGYDLFLYKKGTETYTTHFMVEPSCSIICELIQSGSVTADMKNHHAIQKELTQVKWSIMFNGKSILAFMAYRPKMTYKEIVDIIVNEGGSVDVNGIVHRA